MNTHEPFHTDDREDCDFTPQQMRSHLDERGERESQLGLYDPRTYPLDQLSGQGLTRLVDDYIDQRLGYLPQWAPSWPADFNHHDGNRMLSMAVDVVASDRTDAQVRRCAEVVLAGKVGYRTGRDEGDDFNTLKTAFRRVAAASAAVGARRFRASRWLEPYHRLREREPKDLLEQQQTTAIHEINGNASLSQAEKTERVTTITSVFARLILQVELLDSLLFTDQDGSPTRVRVQPFLLAPTWPTVGQIRNPAHRILLGKGTLGSFFSLLFPGPMPKYKPTVDPDDPNSLPAPPMHGPPTWDRAGALILGSQSIPVSDDLGIPGDSINLPLGAVRLPANTTDTRRLLTKLGRALVRAEQNLDDGTDQVREVATDVSMNTMAAGSAVAGGAIILGGPIAWVGVGVVAMALGLLTIIAQALALRSIKKFANKLGEAGRLLLEAANAKDLPIVGMNFIQAITTVASGLGEIGLKSLIRAFIETVGLGSNGQQVAMLEGLFFTEKAPPSVLQIPTYLWQARFPTGNRGEFGWQPQSWVRKYTLVADAASWLWRGSQLMESGAMIGTQLLVNEGTGGRSTRHALAWFNFDDLGFDWPIFEASHLADEIWGGRSAVDVMACLYRLMLMDDLLGSILKGGWASYPRSPVSGFKDPTPPCFYESCLHDSFAKQELVRFVLGPVVVGSVWQETDHSTLHLSDKRDFAKEKTTYIREVFIPVPQGDFSAEQAIRDAIDAEPMRPLYRDILEHRTRTTIVDETKEGGIIYQFNKQSLDQIWASWSCQQAKVAGRTKTLREHWLNFLDLICTPCPTIPHPRYNPPSSGSEETIEDKLQEKLDRLGKEP